MQSLQAKKRKKKKSSPPFAAVEISTLESESWLCLNRTEALVYIMLKTFYRGDNQSFQAPFDEIKKRSRIKHGQTIYRAIESLSLKEWIEVDRYAKHGRGKGLRVRPNEYKLTFRKDRQRW